MPTDVDSPARPAAPRQPALDRSLAMRLAAAEYDRFTATLRSLSPQDWTRPTACPAWDVRALASHVLGMADMSASVIEQLRQTRKANRRGGVFIDALTAVQVEDRVDLTPVQIVDQFTEAGPRAAAGRRRTPGFVRRRPMSVAQPVGGRPDSPTETWTFGYLLDVILTRDTWLHRSDIAVATGRPIQLTPEHDGAIVADVVREWAQRHGQPCRLDLTGPAGGSWAFGTGGPLLQLGAVDFCRTLSGRAPAQGLQADGLGVEGLLAVEVPF